MLLIINLWILYEAELIELVLITSNNWNYRISIIGVNLADSHDSAIPMALLTVKMLLPVSMVHCIVSLQTAKQIFQKRALWEVHVELTLKYNRIWVQYLHFPMHVNWTLFKEKAVSVIVKILLWWHLLLSSHIILLLLQWIPDLLFCVHFCIWKTLMKEFFIYLCLYVYMCVIGMYNFCVYTYIKIFVCSYIYIKVYICIIYIYIYVPI